MTTTPTVEDPTAARPLQDGERGSSFLPPPPSNYTYVRPLSEASRSFIDVAENPGNRLMLGLPEIDVLTRGFGPRELVLLTGFAHSGKTQLVNTMIVNNAGRRLLFFSLDDPAEMIVVKLLSMKSGLSADELEKAVRRGDPEVRDLLLTAEDQFPFLTIVDQALTFDQMQDAVDEATALWGNPPHGVIIDYMGLVPSHSDGEGSIQDKSKELRRISKSWDWPTLCVHQGTRSQCPPGKPITLLSLAYGGEAEGTMVLGTRRKAEADDADASDRHFYADTITVHLVKNKRPPGKKTSYEGVDYFMDPTTGMIRQPRPGDRSSSPSPAAAARAVTAPPEAQLFVDQLGGTVVDHA